MKYLVMECHPGYAVVVDEEGEFQKVANMHYEVGQTVTQVVKVQIPFGGVQWPRRLAAVAACLVLLLAGLFYTGQQTYGSVYLTINPQVRIDVNRRDTVLSLEGVNSDGERLVQGYSFRGKQMEQVMEELVDRAIAEGFLQDGGQVELYLTGEERWVTEHTSELESHLRHHMRSHPELRVTVGEAEDNCEKESNHHGDSHHEELQKGTSGAVTDKDPEDMYDDPDDDFDDDFDDDPDDDLDDDFDDDPDDDFDEDD